MVIASIDLKDAKVVQLKNGKDTILERDDAVSLIDDFNIYGEVAVIDLNAALRTPIPEGFVQNGKPLTPGDTVNTETLKKLLRRGNVRVGGGIRDVKKAKELISLGAEKVIIGSAAFSPGSQADFMNTAFLDELVKAIGKERIIISVDAVHGKIALKGWTENSGIDLIEGAQQAEQYASELLFTCVEREGCMSGIDMSLVQKLREAVKCRLVVAGGVSTVEEIANLERIGCDVQLGMALYTGAVSLKEAFSACLNWEKVDLITVVAQEASSGEVLMVGYANKEALIKTFKSGNLTFWSRTRNKLWTKGETSGNVLSIRKMRADCDRDTIVASVEPAGGVCHTGSWSCLQNTTDRPYSLEFLYKIISERFANPRAGSYTATLDDELVREKIIEEAEELTEAPNKDEVIWECADLLYFMSVLMYKEKVNWQDIMHELDRRHKK